MDSADALAILDRFKRWNHGQKSVGHAFGGPRTDEDDLYDARRALIKKAYAVLNADHDNNS